MPTAPRRTDPERFHARVLEASTPAELLREIARTDSDPEGSGIMTGKARIYPVRLDSVPLKAAPLLKQEMLAVGADSAHARGVADLSVESSTVVLLGTWTQYRRLIPKLTRQPFQLAPIGRAIDLALHRYTSRAPRTVRGLHRSFRTGEKTLVMGVLNVTPDSFSDGGRFLDPAVAADRARELVAEGADLIDLGGESTRPGATPISSETEWSRIGPVLERLGANFPVPISIDTRSPEVAGRALESGADLINDVGGLRLAAMRGLVARTGAPVIVLHMRGEPPTMQVDTTYADLRGDVYAALSGSLVQAVRDGATPGQLLVDPGLGFGKSAEQSLELLAHLGEFRSLGHPVVVGASRKSFLGRLTGGTAADDRVEAGLAAAVIAAQQGASIVRTHDVRPTVRALAVVDAVRREAGHVGAHRSGEGPDGHSDGFEVDGSSVSRTSDPT
ncbi:MAG: dihydropteroate synthase [Thermoplasmata archaeon]|nr:dihydropteroate synthase [Thermoplasmata archaeon]